MHRRLLVGQMERLRESHMEGEVSDREFERQYDAMTRALVGDETVDRIITQTKARRDELKRDAQLGEQHCDLCSRVAVSFRIKPEPAAKFCFAHGQEDQREQLKKVCSYHSEFRAPPNSVHLWKRSEGA